MLIIMFLYQHDIIYHNLILFPQKILYYSYFNYKDLKFLNLILCYTIWLNKDENPKLYAYDIIYIS